MLQAETASLDGLVPDGAIAPKYESHRPEQTLLYQIVDRHYPDFLAQLAAEDRFLPDYVQQEFTEFLKCGLLEHGFLRVRCESCHHEKLVAFSCKRRGFCPSFRSLLTPLTYIPVGQAVVPAAWWIVQHC